MSITIAELAKAIGATLRGGDPNRTLNSASSLAAAGPDQAAPLSDPRYADLLTRTKAGAVVVKTGTTHPNPPPTTALLQTDDPEITFLKVLELLYPEHPETPGVDPRASVEAGVIIGTGAYVGPFAVLRAGSDIGPSAHVHAHAYIGRNCRLGARCRVFPGAVLYDNVTLGDDVIVHSGAVLGADGFGFKFRNGRHVKVPQVGSLRIGDRVEIGANTAIDRAALGATVVGEGTKIDNLVQIGHNVKIGRHVILCGQAGVAGSSELQDFSVLGAGAGIADHVTIGMAARVGAKSGVHKDVPAQAEVWGLPADERRAAWRQIAAMRRLPELVERVRDLEKKLKDLEGGGASTPAAPAPEVKP